MTPRRRSAVRLAVAAVAAALVGTFVYALVQRPGEPPVRLLGTPVSIVKSLTPQDPQFGDAVVATVDVFSDPHRVDPGSVRIRTSFSPYAVVARTRTARSVGGVRVTHLEARLRCLDVACVPSGDAAGFRFPPVRVGYRVGARESALVSSWSPLRVHSRIAAADLAHPRLRVPPTSGADSGYRLPPAPTGDALLVLAGLLALGGAWLLLRDALGRGLAGRRGTALDRILAELATPSSGDPGRLRRALDELARALQPLDESLSAESRVLAWAPQEPAVEAVLDLTTRVRAAVAR